MRVSKTTWSCLVVIGLTAGCTTLPDAGSPALTEQAPVDSLPAATADGPVEPMAGAAAEREVEMPREAPAEAGREVTAAVGEVVRVNSTDEYVIVDCQRLPSTGEEAKVYRDKWPVGTIRFSGPMHRPFAAADIVSGQLQRGDLVFH